MMKLKRKNIKLLKGSIKNKCRKNHIVFCVTTIT
jgi:hypothetical protein